MNVYVDSKEDRKKEKFDETEEVEDVITEEAVTEETSDEDVVTEEAETEEAETEETSTEDAEEDVSVDEDEEDPEGFDYIFGKETVEETKSAAEKMFNDVVSTLKSRQAEWNKTLEEYKANKPAIDLFEYENELVVKLDAPRVSKEDISIKMTTEAVEIEIDFPEYLEEDEEVKVLRKERCSGKTKNVVALPVEVDIKEVNASFKDNELTIILPKIRGRKVDVEIL